MALSCFCLVGLKHNTVMDLNTIKNVSEKLQISPFLINQNVSGALANLIYPNVLAPGFH